MNHCFTRKWRSETRTVMSRTLKNCSIRSDFRPWFSLKTKSIAAWRLNETWT
jgi:hypothetical protein